MKRLLLFLSITIIFLFFSCSEKISDITFENPIVENPIEIIDDLDGKSKEQAKWGTLVAKIPNNIGNTFTTDPKTTRSITWQSTLENGEVVSGDQNYPSTATKRGNYYHHKVVLSNLEPGTTYSYTAGTTGYHSPEYSFTTESANSAVERFSILHVTDTHMTTTKSYAEIWKRVIGSAFNKLPNPAFVVHSGDVTENSAAGAIPYYYDFAQEILANNAFIYSMGNNDTVSWYNVHFHTPDNEDNGILYYFNYGNALFINVDSEANLTQAQLGRLESYLQNTEQKWKVVITHQADYSRSGKNTNLTKLFDKYNVDLVMAGHNHFYARSKPIDTEGKEKENGTVWTIPNAAGSKFNSTAGKNYLTVDKQPNLPMFSVFKFTEDNIYLEAYTVDAAGNANLFDSYTFHFSPKNP